MINQIITSSDNQQPLSCQNCQKKAIILFKFQYICKSCNCIQDIQILDNRAEPAFEKDDGSAPTNSRGHIEQSYSHPLFQNQEIFDFEILKEVKKPQIQVKKEKYLENVEKIEKFILKKMSKLLETDQNDILRIFRKLCQEFGDYTSYTEHKLKKNAVYSIYQVFLNLCCNDKDTILERICKKFHGVYPFEIQKMIKDRQKYFKPELGQTMLIQNKPKNEKKMEPQIAKALEAGEKLNFSQQELNYLQQVWDIIYEEGLYGGENSKTVAGGIIYTAIQKIGNNKISLNEIAYACDVKKGSTITTLFKRYIQSHLELIPQFQC